MKDKVLGVLLRAHRRAETLELVLSELVRYSTLPGVACRIHVMADRPTQPVRYVLERFQQKIYNVVAPRLPLLSREHGELFMQGLNAQLDDFERVGADWYLVADDDQWFEPHHINTELPAVLHNPDIDIWYAECVFFWDTPTTYHPDRRHCSPVLFRAKPGDRFPTNRIIMATEEVHDTAIIQGRTGRLKTPLLNYGAYSAEERQRVYDTYKEAGKVDLFTESGLIAPARLAQFPADAVTTGLLPDPEWKDLWTLSQAKTR